MLSFLFSLSQFYLPRPLSAPGAITPHKHILQLRLHLMLHFGQRAGQTNRIFTPRRKYLADGCMIGTTVNNMYRMLAVPFFQEEKKTQPYLPTKPGQTEEATHLGIGAFSVLATNTNIYQESDSGRDATQQNRAARR